MKINSRKAQLKVDASATYAFVSNFLNFEKLLPKEKVVVKEISENNIVFEIKGMATIGMTVCQRDSNKLVIAESTGKNPFPFKLNILVEENSNGSEAHLEFDGEVNSFLKMMVESPLTNFFNSLVDELEKQSL